MLGECLCFVCNVGWVVVGELFEWMFCFGVVEMSFDVECDEVVDIWIVEVIGCCDLFDGFVVVVVEIECDVDFFVILVVDFEYVVVLVYVVC